MHRVRGLVCGCVKRSIIKGFAGLTLAIGGQICWYIESQGALQARIVYKELSLFERVIKFMSLIDENLYSS